MSRVPVVLALHWNSADHNEIDWTAGLVVVEHTDRQPSRPPGERIQISAAFVQQRAVGVIVMAVDDVERAETIGGAFRIALPHQRRFALLSKRNCRIDAGVNIEAMGVDMRQSKPVEPGDVGVGYIGCLLYTSPSPRDRQKSRMPSSA